MSEMIPEYGGCLWPTDPGCLDDEWDSLPEETKERALALASSTLRYLTAYRVGGCPVTVRPCIRSCSTAFIPYQGFSQFGPGIDTAGRWVNNAGCGCGDGCGTSCEIELPTPVGRVDEVKADGVVLDPEDYRIDNGNILVWQGTGDCPFPKSQNLNLSDDQPGTMSVTFLNAYPVDSIGAQAAAYLAMEFAKACSGKGKCSLPAGVTQVVRQGISYEVRPGLFPGGRTGIRVVDAFIEMWNPQGRRSGPKVWSPSSPKFRHTTVAPQA